MANTITVETSARHVHLTEKDVELLFGKGHQLTVKKYLSQPGEFASEERVNVIGPKKEIKNVIILGPARKATQVEVAITDAIGLGINAPIRESGDVAGSGACKLVGPAGEIEISEGVIIAKRHVHLRPEDAEKFGVKDKQIVQVKVNTADRATIFGDVVVRVRDTFMPFMHIDTDEANACAANGNVEGEIIM
ncbi:MAG: phosphate propanoyltransferase [Oscillospiraceae bacterium]|nr:phosphate propanoyltransferase [Oscillospiraceae bacterium]